MTLASILIRTKNEGRTLGKVLQAVREQSEQDFEVVVVDSGSHDNTLQIAQHYGACVVAIPPEAFTYGYALNVGMEHSHGEIVVSLSGHAVPCDRYWLANLLAPFADPKIAGASSLQIPEDIYYASPPRALLQFAFQANITQNGMVSRFLFHCASSAVRASVWREIPFDATLKACEDHDWARHVSRLGYKITHCPSSRVIHSHALPPLPRMQKAAKEHVSLWYIYLFS